MAALLLAAAKRGTVSKYARQLPPAFQKPENRTTVTKVLIEPLSGRELDVLRLLGTDLDGPDIARQLVVSLSTLWTHTRSIYNKLGQRPSRGGRPRRGACAAVPDPDALNHHINHHMG
jgi:LuxR family maltose regulon positive regulatory protein